MSLNSRDKGSDSAGNTSRQIRSRRLPSWLIIVLLLLLSVFVLAFLPVGDFAPAPAKAMRDVQNSAVKAHPAPGPARATKGDKDDIDDDWQKK